MTTAVQRRRGTNTEHSTFTGLDGEITVNTTTYTAHIHDGATVGGVPLAKADGSNIVTSSIDINGGTIDGTVIGGTTPAAGSFTTLELDGTGITATGAELNYTDGVTSNIQTQLNTKAPIDDATFTGTTTIPTADINGGTIDGTVIGGTTAAAGSFTTFTSRGIDDNATSTAITIDASKRLNIGKGASVSGAPVEVQANSIGQSLNIYGRASDGFSFLGFFENNSNTQYASIRSSNASNLILRTGGSDRVVVNSSGNVGIGTSSPENNLHVVGASSSTSTVQVSSATTGFAPTLLFDGVVGGVADNVLGQISASWDTHTNVVSAIRFESGGDTVDKDDGLISFYTSASGPTLAERMRIDSSGNVGIGTSSPAHPLQVNGAGQINNVGIRSLSFGSSGTYTKTLTITGLSGIPLTVTLGAVVSAATSSLNAMYMYSGTGSTNAQSMVSTVHTATSGFTLGSPTLVSGGFSLSITLASGTSNSLKVVLVGGGAAGATVTFA